MNGPKRPLLRGLPPHAVITKTVTMEDLRSESFAAVNPLRKVPAAIDAKRRARLVEGHGGAEH